MWDERARVHARGNPMYPVHRVRNGGSGWGMPLPDDLGTLRGKTVLHLQCHIGMDSLDWAARGAKVTGVDFSTAAIAQARRLSRASGIPATFVESDVYRIPRLGLGRFDRVISSYGTICWLPDLAGWARIIARALKPGGFFYLADIHPVWFCLEWDGPRETPRLAHSYFASGALRFIAAAGTYANPSASTRRRVNYSWQHHPGEIVGALRAAGLTLAYLHEWPYAYWNYLYYTRRRWMARDRKGFWHLRGLKATLPLMFSIKATRTGR